MSLQLTRPKSFNEFVGKKCVKERLEVYVKSCIINDWILDHCLLFGHPGTGKTSIANIIANELKSNIKIIQGPSITKPSDLYMVVLNMRKADILFIDEIHAMNSQCFEILYSIMEDFVIDVCLGKDINSKVTRISLPKFTLIGATTNMHLIPQPLEDRFGIIINIDKYSDHEIFQILKSYKEKENLKIDDNKLKIISKHSKGIPRISLRILKRVNDFIIVKGNMDIYEILDKIGIYELGLNIDDMNYLNLLLNSTKNIGLKTISQTLNLNENYILNKIENYLLELNLISKETNGRLITKKGIEVVKKIIKRI